MEILWWAGVVVALIALLFFRKELTGDMSKEEVEKAVQQLQSEEDERKMQTLERHKKLSIEEVILSDSISELEKIAILQEKQGLSYDEAMEIISSGGKARRKAKLSSIKRSVARKAYELHGVIPTDSREPISEAVRTYVWNRDSGKCVKCSSNERIEFDHILPVAKGGSSTARNIQILCETCNRQKSDEI